MKVLPTNPLALERAGKGDGILARRGALQSLEASRREEVSGACKNPLSLVDVGDRREPGGRRTSLAQGAARVGELLLHLHQPKTRMIFSVNKGFF